MSLFSSTQVVLWPKSKTTEFYLDKKEANNFTFDINLWQPIDTADLTPLRFFLKQNKINSCYLLVPDDILITKSFIYDSLITQIDKKEVIGLAESFVRFKIEPDYLSYNLISAGEKTIIQASIIDFKKMKILEANLRNLNLKIIDSKSVSACISTVINSVYQKEYFLIYPLGSQEYSLSLSRGNSLYLATQLKGPLLEIQKIINYSNLYFSTPVEKIFLPENKEIELSVTSKLDKTFYNNEQIAQNFHKASNLPLPVIGFIINQSPHPNSKPQMENKKNILPIVAVFVITAALASIIIWFLLNRGSSDNLANPSVNQPTTTPTSVQTQPTQTPVPSVVEINKKLKLQVLNATDINGQAAVLKGELTKLGFTSIAVGNAAEKVTANTVNTKASVSSSSAYFTQALAGKFDATYSATLKETSTYDVVFTIGTNLSKVSVTPTSKP